MQREITADQRMVLGFRNGTGRGQSPSQSYKQKAALVDMLEKARAVALLKTLEDPSDVVFGNHKLLLYLREQPVHSPLARTGLSRRGFRCFRLRAEHWFNSLLVAVKQRLNLDRIDREIPRDLRNREPQVEERPK
jgi:hypothetical protein